MSKSSQKVKYRRLTKASKRHSTVGIKPSQIRTDTFACLDLACLDMERETLPKKVLKAAMQGDISSVWPG